MRGVMPHSFAVDTPSDTTITPVSPTDSYIYLQLRIDMTIDLLYSVVTTALQREDKPMASTINLHPLLDAFMGDDGLFDVMPSAMDLNIGRYIRYINPTCKARTYIHRIICVQKIYDGSLAYRAVVDDPTFQHGPDTFGSPARPEEVEFIK